MAKMPQYSAIYFIHPVAGHLADGIICLFYIEGNHSFLMAGQQALGSPFVFSP